MEGLLFNYKHFWGDYSHYIVSHAWYSKEIRIIRNDPDIHSWRDAQSFRRIPEFDGYSYFQKENTYKLKVAEVDAVVYHYGWVRPPDLMQKKTSVLSNRHDRETKRLSTISKDEPDAFDYGNLSKLWLFKETHPEVMKDFIKKFNWQHQLYPQNKKVRKHKQDKLKYRLLSFIEQNILGGKQIAGLKNYNLVKPKPSTR